MPRTPGRQRQRAPRGQHRRLVADAPLPLALEQELVRPGKDVVVQGGLDLEDLHVVPEQPAHPPGRGVQRRALVVHERARRHHRVGVVVVLEAAVGGQADADGLVAAVHRDEVDVDVDQQVGLGGAAADLDVLAAVGLAQVREVVAVLGVEVVQAPLRVERPEDPLADDVPQLGRRHPPVQRVGRDDLDVVDPGLGGHGQHLLDDALAHVGRAHRRQRQRDVVEGDGQAHAGEELAGQRVVVDRVQERVADRRVGVGHRRQRLGRVDHPRAQRELLEAEAETLVHHQRRRAVVDLQDESRPAHGLLLIGCSSSPRRAGRRPP